MALTQCGAKYIGLHNLTVLGFVRWATSYLTKRHSYRLGLARTLKTPASASHNQLKDERIFNDNSESFQWEIDQKWDLPLPLIPPAAQNEFSNPLGSTIRSIEILSRTKRNGTKNELTKTVSRIVSGRIDVPTIRCTPFLTETVSKRLPILNDENCHSVIEETIDEYYNSNVDEVGQKSSRIKLKRDIDGSPIFIHNAIKGDSNVLNCEDKLVERRKSISTHNREMLTEAYAVDIEGLEETLELQHLTKSKEEEKNNNKENDNEYEDENLKLTPAQLFFLENRDKLLERAQEYHTHKLEHFDELPDENPSTKQFKANFDTFYRDPVIRLPKNYLWDFGNSKYNIPNEEVELEQGRMPSIDDIVKILAQERIAEIRVINLDKCGRRDLGLFLVIGTGRTGLHCHRVGKTVAKLINKLEIPYISETTYCWGSQHDNWIVAHCGPLQVQLLTDEMRKKFRVEEMLLAPHEFFKPDIFPGYFDSLPGTPPPYVVKYVEILQKKEKKIQDALLENDGFTSS